METVFTVIGVVLVFLWFISGMFRNRRDEADEEESRELEARIKSRKTRDKYDSDPEFRKRVHDYYNDD